MKNCPKCGIELADEVTVCPECGEALVVVEAAPEVETAPKKKSPAKEAASKKKSPAKEADPKKKSPAKILSILSLVFACVPLTQIVGFILSIVGIVFGVKEMKASGKKKYLIMSIIATVLSIILAVVYLVLLLILAVVLVGVLGVGGGFLLTILTTILAPVISILPYFASMLPFLAELLPLLMG